LPQTEIKPLALWTVNSSQASIVPPITIALIVLGRGSPSLAGTPSMTTIRIRGPEEVQSTPESLGRIGGS
jgi:hypothetical protein